MTPAGSGTVDRAAFAVHLAERLRAAGAAAPLTGAARLAEALAAVPPSSRPRLYWTARVALLQRHADLAVFDAVFDEVFGASLTGAIVEARWGTPPARRRPGPAPGRPGRRASKRVAGSRGPPARPCTPRRRRPMPASPCPSSGRAAARGRPTRPSISWTPPTWPDSVVSSAPPCTRGRPGAPTATPATPRGTASRCGPPSPRRGAPGGSRSSSYHPAAPPEAPAGRAVRRQPVHAGPRDRAAPPDAGGDARARCRGLRVLDDLDPVDARPRAPVPRGGDRHGHRRGRRPVRRHPHRHQRPHAPPLQARGRDAGCDRRRGLRWLGQRPSGVTRRGHGAAAPAIASCGVAEPPRRRPRLRTTGGVDGGRAPLL